VDPDAARFAECLDELETFLVERGEVRWADRVGRDASLVRAGDARGVIDFRSMFGGMGSLSDLVFSPVNGNAATEVEAVVLNDQVERLRTRAWTLAEHLRRSP
jgi:hypothetical protein